MATPEKMREYRKTYKLKYPDRIKISKERWRKNNLDRWANWTKEWRDNNPDAAKATEARYLASDKGRNLISIKNARRRAILNKVDTEPYNRIEVYKQYQGICCICTKLIQLDLPPRHPLSFTIQHHVPLSKGGSDTLSNIGIAHYSCNSKVGNRKVTNAR